MTPDGISTDDWDRVQELAVGVVNLSGQEQYEASDEAARELLEVLDELQERYGPLPSVLATRADYVTSSADREYWLLAAYREAENRKDRRNQTWISHSLAVHYVEGAEDEAEGLRWLTILESALQEFRDEEAEEDLARLRSLLSKRRRSGRDRGAVEGPSWPRR